LLIVTYWQNDRIYQVPTGTTGTETGFLVAEVEPPSE
jgi:hypothetical protein